MGIFGDRDLKRLRRELEEGKLAMQIGPRLGPEMMQVGIENTRRDLNVAVQRLVATGRSGEAAELLRRSRVAGAEGAEALWNEILDEALGRIGS